MYYTRTGCLCLSQSYRSGCYFSVIVVTALYGMEKNEYVIEKGWDVCRKAFSRLGIPPSVQDRQGFVSELNLSSREDA